MGTQQHILFVCTGNICRSPMAEGLMRELVKNHPGYKVSSAGVAAGRGQPASQNAVQALKPLGIDISGIRSRPLTGEIIDGATHIFGMTQNHVDLILTFFPQASEKVFLVNEFLTKGGDIPDPFGGNLNEYLKCRDQIRQALPSILHFIEKNS